MPTLDLTGGKLDITIKTGDDPAFRLGPTSADLSTWTWTGQIRDTQATSGNLLGAFTITADATGANIRLPHTTTRALPAIAYYDIQVADPTGHITTLLSGKLKATTDVTL